MDISILAVAGAVLAWAQQRAKVPSWPSWVNLLLAGAVTGVVGLVAWWVLALTGQGDYTLGALGAALAWAFGGNQAYWLANKSLRDVQLTGRLAPLGALLTWLMPAPTAPPAPVSPPSGGNVTPGATGGGLGNQ